MPYTILYSLNITRLLRLEIYVYFYNVTVQKRFYLCNLGSSLSIYRVTVAFSYRRKAWWCIRPLPCNGKRYQYKRIWYVRGPWRHWHSIYIALFVIPQSFEKRTYRPFTVVLPLIWHWLSKNTVVFFLRSNKVAFMLGVFDKFC